MEIHFQSFTSKTRRRKNTSNNRISSDVRPSPVVLVRKISNQEKTSNDDERYHHNHDHSLFLDVATTLSLPLLLATSIHNMAIIMAPVLRKVSIGTVVVLSGLLLFINGWIVVDVEGMLPRLAQDDDISYILRKDVGRVVGIQGLVLMLLVLYMQQYQERAVMAASFVTAYTFTNMLVFGVDSATLILFVIPAASLLVLLSDAFDHPDPPLEVWKGYRELYESTSLKGWSKTSLIMYCVVVAMQIFLVGSSLFYPFHTFYFDNYDIESPEAMDARRLEIQAHAWFGLLVGFALFLQGPTRFTYSTVVSGYLLIIVQGRIGYHELTETDASTQLLQDWIAGWWCFVGFWILEMVGFILYLWVERSKSAFSTEGTTAEQQQLLA